MYNNRKSKKKIRNKKRKYYKEDKKEKEVKNELCLIQDNVGNKDEIRDIGVFEQENDINKLTEERKQKLKNIDIQKEVLRYIKENTLNLNIGKKLNFSDSIFKENNYILTEKIKEKLSQLYLYMRNQIPCILEGETGTSKTFSTIILTKYLSKNWKKEKLNQNLN